MSEVDRTLKKGKGILINREEIVNKMPKLVQVWTCLKSILQKHEKANIKSDKALNVTNYELEKEAGLMFDKYFRSDGR